MPALGCVIHLLFRRPGQRQVYFLGSVAVAGIGQVGRHVLPFGAHRFMPDLPAGPIISQRLCLYVAELTARDIFADY